MNQTMKQNAKELQTLADSRGLEYLLVRTGGANYYLHDTDTDDVYLCSSVVSARRVIESLPSSNK